MLWYFLKHHISRLKNCLHYFYNRLPVNIFKNHFDTYLLRRITSFCPQLTIPKIFSTTSVIGTFDFIGHKFCVALKTCIDSLWTVNDDYLEVKAYKIIILNIISRLTTILLNVAIISLQTFEINSHFLLK